MDYCTKCRHQQLDYSRINTLWLQMADKNRKDKSLKKVKEIEKKCIFVATFWRVVLSN